jgi:hypothetical protein
MPLTLTVDGPRWRDHLVRTATAHPGLVPVAKGTGYGFSIGSLARRSSWLGTDMLAVGSYREVAEVQHRFDGDILVMEPWRPFYGVPDSSRLVHTIGRASDLAGLVERSARRPRVVLEGLTSMCRHGLERDDLGGLLGSAAGVHIEGIALHLPLGDGHLDEIEPWLAAIPHDRWFVSHVDDRELATLTSRHQNITFRPRIGTSLWLGDRGALQVRATVTDVHPVKRGDRVGYRQRRILRAGAVVIVSGGTAHGIGLEAPAAAASSKQRAVSVAKGGLEATGRSLSPYLVDGRQRWFVEPPHMQASMIFVPAGTPTPAIGDQLDVRVRFTTTTFDQVTIT